MATDRLRLVLRAIAAAVLVGGGALLAYHAPAVLRSLEAFRVDRVQVLGARYLTAREVLEAGRIDRSSNLFDDVDVWRAALLEHPLIEAVDIERDLPGTLVLRIDEADPIAFVRTPVLRPVDAAGRVLPIDPAVALLDLPVLATPAAVGRDGRLTDAAARDRLTALDRLNRLAPAFARRVSEVQPAPAGEIHLLLRDPRGAEALLPAYTESVRFERLHRALAHLLARGELGRVRRIDLRFHDQIVVALTPG